MNKENGILIVFSGPSGAGKDTVLEQLLKKSDIVKSVSATTRAMREGETDGTDYYFVSREAFLSMIEKGEMLEYAEYVGNFYGTPRKPVEQWLSEGKDVLLKIEVQGGRKVKSLMPESVGIFIMPPSPEELERRLRNRGTDDEDAIRKRLQTAVEEMKCAGDYDYVVVNDRIEDAVEEIKALTERIKLERRRRSVENGFKAY